MKDKLIYCNLCGTTLSYNDNAIYLKCPNCKTVLIEDKIDNEEINRFIIVDYGIDHLEDGDWMWVEVEDKYGNKHTYYKRKDSSEDFRKSC